MTVNVKVVMMEHLWCDVVLKKQNKKNQLLLNIHIGYFSVLRPPV